LKDSCSARAFDLVTQVLASYAQSGGPFFGIYASNHGQVMISPRGIPLKRNGHVVEALEVSGGMGEQDQAVAEAGGKQRRGLRLAMTWSRHNGRGGWDWGDKRSEASCVWGIFGGAPCRHTAFVRHIGGAMHWEVCGPRSKDVWRN
jgi:hypothetical protein